MCGVFGVVLPGPRADRGRVDRGARPVRAPASRPGIGRAGGQRRRAADALQGPRDDQHGPRRAPPAEPARPARDRPLPLLDDGFDDLGERPADVPARAAPGARDRPQRQPRQHARPARAAQGRPGAPAGLDRHGAADRAPGRRAGRRHGRGAAPGPAARPRRVQPGRSSTSGGSSACAIRSASGRWSSGACPRSTPSDGDDGLWHGDDAVGRLVPVVRDGGPRHRRRRVRPRRPAGRDGHPRAGPGAALGPLRRRDARAVRLRAHLLRPARLVHGGPQPVRGPSQDGHAAGDRAPDRRRPRDARPRHRGARRGRVRRGSPACRTARGCTATGTPGGRSSSRRPGCATAA